MSTPSPWRRAKSWTNGHRRRFDIIRRLSASLWKLDTCPVMLGLIKREVADWGAMVATTHSVNIENVVSTTDAGHELQLENLSSAIPEAEYTPGRFPGLVYRMQDPDVAALIFRSGKIVCTGATSVADAEAASETVFADFRDIGIEVTRSPDIQIHNIVSSGDLGHELDLPALAIGMGLERVEYEPEQFPGLIYRLEDPSVVALLFNSGRVVISGGTYVGEAEAAITEIYDQLRELGFVGS